MSHAEKVVIIGAGDHGRGALEIFREASRHGGYYVVLGFLDDSQQKQGVMVGGLPVLGGLDWIHDQHRPEIGYVMGIADARAKQRIAQRLDERSLTFVSVVHPSAFIANGVRIAPGALINAGAAIAYDTVIEEHTTVNLNATIGHDCVLGRFSTVAPGANIAGRVRLGEGCDIGLNATVGKGLDVGEWSSVGPGTVVIKSVAARQHVFGNPARVVAPFDQLSRLASQP
jgi:sugar O-acyltransferase (sialic acid O-acetyltransferase NeuD family)